MSAVAQPTPSRSRSSGTSSPLWPRRWAPRCRRAAFSPNIKERRDYSCALFDPERRRGRPGRPHARPPGRHADERRRRPSRSWAARARGRRLPERPLPRRHPPAGRHAHRRRCTLRRAASSDTSPRGLTTATSAGSTPGSMPLAREIFEEGLRIPPVRLYRAGRRNEDLWRDAPGQRAHAGRSGRATWTRSSPRSTRGAPASARDRRPPGRGRDARGHGGARSTTRTGSWRRASSGSRTGATRRADHLEDDGFGSGPIPIRCRADGGRPPR